MHDFLMAPIPLWAVFVGGLVANAVADMTWRRRR